jgi:hypothetical protein
MLAAVLLMAVGFAIWALQAERKARDAQKSAISAQRHAEDARKRASARQLAGQAFQKRDDELDLALLIALESRSVAEKVQGTELEKSVAVTDATSSVLRALLSPPQLQRLMRSGQRPGVRFGWHDLGFGWIRQDRPKMGSKRDAQKARTAERVCSGGLQPCRQPE